MPATIFSAVFDEDASYIIIGGLGGLGQAMCHWMARRGCKNIIALSRSGMKSASGKGLKENLDQIGVRVAIYACDVSNSEEVDRVVTVCAQDMPQIKGIINAGMVIRVRIALQHHKLPLTATLRIPLSTT